MDRIEKLREYIDEILLKNSDNVERRCGYIHLYGVAQACVMIAGKRHLDAELAVMAGMLHDIYTYQYSYCEDHAQKGAVLAREILQKLNITTQEETDIICGAINSHSDKGITGGAYEELLKDADVLQHCTYNPVFPVKSHEKERYAKLRLEFGIDV